MQLFKSGAGIADAANVTPHGQTRERRPPPARAYLRTRTGHRIELLPNRVYIIGRLDICDIQIDDSGCSRRHARISVAGDVRYLYLQDLESKNGTFINEVQLQDRIQLNDGDRIRIGETEFQVNIWTEADDAHLDTRTNVMGK